MIGAPRLVYPARACVVGEYLSPGYRFPRHEGDKRMKIDELLIRRCEVVEGGRVDVFIK
jgi:hypothetical protein